MSARMSWLRGILPFVERTSGGIRMFKEQDYEWMKIIECMKRAGMPIKDIRDYIELALEGDATIHERLQLFQNQKRLVQEQMKSLQHTLDVLDYKCWYYETAESAGTTDVLKRKGIWSAWPEWSRKVYDLKNAHGDFKANCR